MIYVIVFGLGLALGLIGGLYGLAFAMKRALFEVEQIVTAAAAMGRGDGG